jgi:autotransporter-associated beta strand protein
MISPHWVSTPDGQWWDKTVVELPPGYYRITFNPVAGVSTPPEQIFQITANNITTVEGVYGTNIVSTPVVVLTSPLDQQTLWGTSLSATAIVAAGTPPYTVTVYTNTAGGAYTPAGVATTEPYTVSLGALPIGTYGIYATVTDSSIPLPKTATSATHTFIVSPLATWTNSAATGNWSDPLSWDSGEVPVSGATAVFGTGGSTSVVDTVSRNVSSILFTRAADFVLSASGGAGLTINNGITASNNFTNTISAPVTLGGANIWTVNDTGTLQVSGTVGGNAPLAKAGTGTLALAGNNTFTGGVTLKAGTLLLGSGNALGTGPFTINGGYINGTSGSLTMPHNNPVVRLPLVPLIYPPLMVQAVALRCRITIQSS